MNKIRGLEKGFMATHLINIGAKIGSIRKTDEKREEGFIIAINRGEVREIEIVKYDTKYRLRYTVEGSKVLGSGNLFVLQRKEKR